MACTFNHLVDMMISLNTELGTPAVSRVSSPLPALRSDTVTDRTIRVETSHLPTTSFSFLLLPRELRDEIYFLYLGGSRLQDLSKTLTNTNGIVEQSAADSLYSRAWKQPDLFLVSKQIRREAIPIFFQRCHFGVTVTSDLINLLSFKGIMSMLLAHADSKQYVQHQLIQNAKRAGIALLPSSFCQWAKHNDVKPYAFLRNIQISEVLAKGHPDAVSRVFGKVDIRTTGKNISFEVWRRSMGTTYLEVEEHPKMQERLMKAAEKMVKERHDYKGFSIEDIQVLALAFRVGDLEEWYEF